MKKTTNKRKPLIKDKNTLAVIGVVLLAFVTALVIFVVGRMTPNLDEQPTIVELMNVVGLPVVEAESTLEAQGFNVIVAGAEPNSEYAKGTIYRQSVPAGSKIRPDYKITLYPSAGATKALTPNLIQTTIEDARVKINNTTFVLGTIDYVNDDIDKGYIISQDPSANLEAADDTVINVVVSLGPEYNNAIMPKIRELTLEEAQKIIIEIGLEIDEITYEAHETIEKGAIISQSIAEGTEVDLDSMVSVVVSTGSGEEEVVDPVEGDPNAVTTKTFSVQLPEHVGQDVTVKVLFEKDGQVSVIHNQVHAITADVPAAPVELQGSGKGTLSIFVNDVLFTSTSVDFSN